MSLVQAFIYKDYIVVGGDSRATFINNTISETYRKVFKLNKFVIVGLTGSIGANACLFGDYINKDFSLSQLCTNSSYNDIINHLTDVYYKNLDLINTIDNGVGLHSIICGWDGTKMTGKAFFSKDDNPDLVGINDVTPSSNDQLRIVNCGLSAHYQNAIKFVAEENPKNILQIKNIFKNVVDTGVKFDGSINKNIIFEKIKKNDM